MLTTMQRTSKREPQEQLSHPLQKVPSRTRQKYKQKLTTSKQATKHASEEASVEELLGISCLKCAGCKVEYDMDWKMGIQDGLLCKSGYDAVAIGATAGT